MSVTIDREIGIDDLELVKLLQSRKSEFLPHIKEVYEKVKNVLEQRIPHVFPNYTLHNIGHSLRIIKNMASIVEDIDQLDELEIAILILSALLHDVGMAVSEEDIKLIKNDDFPYFEIKYSAVVKTIEDEELALQEYVRMFHSSLSAKYIQEELKGKFDIPRLSLNFTKELALICESHTKGFDWITSNLTVNELKGDYRFNSQFLACVLRLADILDIDSNRTPFNLYQLISPTGISKEEWDQHFIISNNQKIKKDSKTGLKTIYFTGQCESPHTHRKILTYIDWVAYEITNCTQLANTMSSQYNLLYDTTPEVQIQTIGYTFSDYKMKLDYKAISALLMGEKIYGDKSLGLRELIQNSIDSCKIRQEIVNENLQIGAEKYVPKIKIIINEAQNEVTIKDNGTGMSLEIIKKHFLNIGVSYYTSKDFKLRDLAYKPIGNFGIGFLSCFMLSDEVKVITRYYKSSDRYLINLEKNNEYTSLTKAEDHSLDGTEIILNYKNFINVFENNSAKVVAFMNKYFLTDDIQVELYDNSNVPILISNNLKTVTVPDGLIKIDLSNYLKDIEGYALIKKKSDYVSSINHIDFKGTLFQYSCDGIKIVQDTSAIDIDNFIINSELKYYNIPIVRTAMENDFLSILKYNDLEDTIDKLERDLEWISVIVPNNLDLDFKDFEFANIGDYLYDNLGYENLIELGHSNNCKTYATYEKVNLFEGKTNELYLPFQSVILSKNTFYYRRYEEKRKELYVRNVLINNFRYEAPTQAKIFDIEMIMVNLNSRKFVPDISRNNFDYPTSLDINYIIGKAIHLGAFHNLGLEDDKKFTLKKFIQSYYCEKSEFEI
ncbi:HD domain-containing protein [Flavobacterium flavigenum]|uniref:HD domain-containing protein n=1 Tax=Flavobacterium flavigenum TaxID=3003258 RepID=UPI0022AC0A66|nr:ATP-binding protein [Flavobacterium flavigenum]